MNDATQLGVSVDDATLPPDIEGADVEVESLQDVVDTWINARKEEAAAVVDLDAEDGGEWVGWGGDGCGGGGYGDGENEDGDGERGDGDFRGGDGDRGVEIKTHAPPQLAASSPGVLWALQEMEARLLEGLGGGAARVLAVLAASKMLLVVMKALRPTGLGCSGVGGERGGDAAHVAVGQCGAAAVVVNSAESRGGDGERAIMAAAPVRPL